MAGEGEKEPIVTVETKETKEDVNADGVDDYVTTTIKKTDVDADGQVDIVQTSVVAVDKADNILKSTLEVDALNVDAQTAFELQTVNASDEAKLILAEIKSLEAKISCPSVQHLGSMEDYAELFRKAQEYIEKAGDKNVNLVVDTSVLEKFAAEAEIYSEMFQEVELKFSRLSTVDDTEMLRKVRDYLAKIALMYQNIQKFHATITTTSILQIPDSIKVVTESMQSVVESIECSMPYLEFFADSTTELTEEQRSRSELNDKDKAAIVAAIRSLDLWLDMINNEANVTMNSNVYIQAFKEKIAKFDEYADRLKSVVSKVSGILANWHSGKF